LINTSSSVVVEEGFGNGIGFADAGYREGRDLSGIELESAV
jgi:hypothetical protein